MLRLAQLWQDCQQVGISMSRLGDILNTRSELPRSRQALPTLKGEISFQNVRFRYRPDGPLILEDVSLSIRPGEVVGIVGRSGSGKSTLAKLLQRLYLPEYGSILVDGIDLSLADPAWLRRQIGVVLQENCLFNRSIRENIALADPGAPLDDVIRSAKVAGAHDFVVGFAEGYDMMVGEQGSNLSGGQKQRIAIARALLTDPRILIELVETPVHPAPRWTARAIIALGIAALLICVFGKLDIVVTAKGKLIPSVRVKVIQPALTGVVREILVRDAQRVVAGQLLMKLDATQAAADADKARTAKWDAELSLARAHALLDAQRDNHPPVVEAIDEAIPAERRHEAERLAGASYREYQDKLESAHSELLKRQAELDATREEIAKLSDTAPLARRQANDYKALVGEKYVAQHDYLAKEQAALEAEHELAAQRSHMEIVPDDSLEVEATVENKDIGFVNAGQDAVIKLETFPYTRYGYLTRKIVSVSNDAVQDKKLGLAFIARIRLPTNRIHIENKWIALTPGMAVNAGIKTGKRTVGEYFLGPLVQGMQESMHEH